MMMMMIQEEVREKGSIGGAWARLCDTCRVVPCTVYCRADSAYLCTGCDARVHGANHVASRHERVWVCEACEQAPAAFLCKADAASLCAACDADVHSANPLARRHHRVPILPIAAGGLQGGPPAVGDRVVGSVGGEEEDFLAPEIEEGVGEEDEDEDETASWLLPNPMKGDNDNDENHGYVMGGEVVDEYLDLVEYNSGSGPDRHQYGGKECNLQKDYGIDNTKSCGEDSVVPVQSKVYFQYQQHHKNHNEQGFTFGFDCETKPAYSSYNTTMSHRVSVSSIDAGVVPESTMNSDIPSISTPRLPTKGTIDLFSGPPPTPIQLPTVLSPMDREARVLRYREKKKTRKFEKTIRYASRKAYAETRPRIKGRFAKRSEVEEVEVDQVFSNGIMAGAAGYRIVPSF